MSGSVHLNGVRQVAAALLCFGAISCTAIFGLTDKPLVTDAGPTAPQAILFGGFNLGDETGDNTTLLNDTWAFDGQSWKELTPHTSPSVVLAWR
jgi:hypothetical protein